MNPTEGESAAAIRIPAPTVAVTRRYTSTGVTVGQDGGLGDHRDACDLVGTDGQGGLTGNGDSSGRVRVVLVAGDVASNDLGGLDVHGLARGRHDVTPLHRVECFGAECCRASPLRSALGACPCVALRVGGCGDVNGVTVPLAVVVLVRVVVVGDYCDDKGEDDSADAKRAEYLADEAS
jgi:hypothetical protein